MIKGFHKTLGTGVIYRLMSLPFLSWVLGCLLMKFILIVLSRYLRVSVPWPRTTTFWASSSWPVFPPHPGVYHRLRSLLILMPMVSSTCLLWINLQVLVAVLIITYMYDYYKLELLYFSTVIMCLLFIVWNTIMLTLLF